MTTTPWLRPWPLPSHHHRYRQTMLEPSTHTHTSAIKLKCVANSNIHGRLHLCIGGKPIIIVDVDVDGWRCEHSGRLHWQMIKFNRMAMTIQRDIDADSIKADNDFIIHSSGARTPFTYSYIQCVPIAAAPLPRATPFLQTTQYAATATVDGSFVSRKQIFQFSVTHKHTHTVQALSLLLLACDKTFWWNFRFFSNSTTSMIYSYAMDDVQ